MTFDERSYLAGQSVAYLQQADEAVRAVMVEDLGEHQVRAEALRAIDALRCRIRNRWDDEAKENP